MPSSLPAPSLPAFTWDKFVAAIPNGCAIALLGAIESLLSAVIADGMTGRRHRSNCELVAQGAANIGSVMFGGICATGTIARTATNVRAGARGPISGLFHSGYLLLFMLFAAPLVAYIPLAALGAVLLVVAWKMAEKSEFIALIRGSRADALVLLSTFLLTVFVDLTTGIAVGVVLGAFLFLHRMAEAVEVASGIELVAEDKADVNGARTAYDAAAGDRSRRDGLPHQRRAVLRRDDRRQHRARPRRRAAEIVRARFQQCAADRHHRRQRVARLRAEARALGNAHLFRRRAAAGQADVEERRASTRRPSTMRPPPPRRLRRSRPSDP